MDCPNYGQKPSILEFTVTTYECKDCGKVFCMMCVDHEPGLLYQGEAICPGCGSKRFGTQY